MSQSCGHCQGSDAKDKWGVLAVTNAHTPAAAREQGTSSTCSCKGACSLCLRQGCGGRGPRKAGRPTGISRHPSPLNPQP